MRSCGPRTSAGSRKACSRLSMPPLLPSQICLTQHRRTIAGIHRQFQRNGSPLPSQAICCAEAAPSLAKERPVRCRGYRSAWDCRRSTSGTPVISTLLRQTYRASASSSSPRSSFNRRGRVWRPSGRRRLRSAMSLRRSCGRSSPRTRRICTSTRRSCR